VLQRKAQRVIFSMYVAGGVIGEERHAVATAGYVRPVEDDVMLDTVPAVEEGVVQPAFRYVVRRILAELLLRQVEREQYLQFETVVVKCLPVGFGFVAFRLRIGPDAGIPLPVDLHLHVYPALTAGECDVLRKRMPGNRAF